MTLKPKDYIPRLQDTTLHTLLGAFGGVEIAGPKFSGKTWAALACGGSVIDLAQQSNKSLAELDIQYALEGDKPHIIEQSGWRFHVRETLKITHI